MMISLLNEHRVRIYATTIIWIHLPNSLALKLTTIKTCDFLETNVICQLLTHQFFY